MHSTAPMHAAHAHLRDELEHVREVAAELPALSPEERAVVLRRILDFLDEELLPHAREEELGLYAEAAAALGDQRALETMVYDHSAIRRIAGALATAPLGDVARLQELLYGLYTLALVHFEKEEQIVEPLVEPRLGAGYDASPVLEHEP